MRKLRRLATDAGFGLAVLVLISPALLVFLWMLSLSLKTELDNTAWPPVFIPDPPTLDNYRDVFARNDFLLFAWNSVVTGSSTAIDRNASARSARGPKLGRPSVFSGRPASSAATVETPSRNTMRAAPETSRNSVPRTGRHQRWAGVRARR